VGNGTYELSDKPTHDVITPSTPTGILSVAKTKYKMAATPLMISEMSQSLKSNRPLFSI
jgi:hypothetical protein